MARKHYNVDEVLTILSRKNDVRIFPQRKSVEILSEYVNKGGKIIPNPSRKNDLGNKSWGKIDYLRNHCGYSIYKVPDFSKF